MNEHTNKWANEEDDRQKGGATEKTQKKADEQGNKNRLYREGENPVVIGAIRSFPFACNLT